MKTPLFVTQEEGWKNKEEFLFPLSDKLVTPARLLHGTRGETRKEEEGNILSR